MEIDYTTNGNNLIMNYVFHEKLQRSLAVEKPSINQPVLSTNENLCEEVFFSKNNSYIKWNKWTVQSLIYKFRENSPELLGDCK